MKSLYEISRFQLREVKVSEVYCDQDKKLPEPGEYVMLVNDIGEMKITVIEAERCKGITYLPKALIQWRH